ncbi:MAG TPA: limonene-1,2-epoxide hydrolase family protein [Ilumatobacteraceae bacterium]|nr:limonene-1,2-epoxide hydrolase family protein [Ilumatobacteraceae bacterium]
MPGDIVDRFIGLIERRQLDDALALLAPDGEYDNVPFGPITGVDCVRGILGPFVERFDEVSWVVTHQVSSGTPAAGVVMNERLDRFRQGERWIELRVAGLFVVRHERIALWRDYFDQGQFQQAMADLG